MSSGWRILHGSSQVTPARDKAEAHKLAERYSAWVQRLDPSTDDWHTVSTQGGGPIDHDAQVAVRILRNVWDNPALTAEDIARTQYLPIGKARTALAYAKATPIGDQDRGAAAVERIARLIRQPGLGGLGAAAGRPANATPVAMLARELQVSARDAADLARQAGLTVDRGHIVDRTADGSGWDRLHAQCTPCLLNAIRAKRATLSIAFIQFSDRLTGGR